MADCQITVVSLLTNADLARAIRQLRTDLRKCNADKAALREWSRKVAE